MCDEALQLLDSLEPAVVVAGQRDTQHAVLGALKQVHDYLHSLAPGHCGPLEDLVVADGVDAEQIWQMLEMMNGELTPWLKGAVRRAEQQRPSLQELATMVEDHADEVDGEHVEEDDDDDDDNDDNDGDLVDDYMDGSGGGSPSEDEGGHVGDGKAKRDFFSMADMEKFVRDAEARAAAAEEGDGGADEELLGLIDGTRGDAADDNARYEEFFGHDDGGADQGDDEFDFDVEQLQTRDVDAALLSAFEQRAVAVASQIRSLEDQNLEDKHWALKGEVSKADRPESSLLESYLDFDHVAQAAPLLTEQHTAKVEALIKRRVLEGSFDDVLRKTRAEATRFKPKVQLDFKRSAKGLGDIMEDAYMRAMGASDPTNEDDLTPEQKTAQKLFVELCRSLDALTNHHYRPSAPKVREIFATAKNVPAISLEEVAPVGVSGARLLAPEEIGGRRSAVEKSSVEMDHGDRKKHRKQRKERTHKRERERESRMKEREAVDPAFAAKRKAARQVAAIGTVKGTTVQQSSIGGGTKAGKEFSKSTTFFANLQERAAQDQRAADAPASEHARKRTKGSEGATGHKYKL